MRTLTVAQAVALILGWACALVLAIADARSLVDSTVVLTLAGAVTGWVLSVERRLTRVLVLAESIAKSVESIAKDVEPIIAALGKRRHSDQ